MESSATRESKSFLTRMKKKTRLSANATAGYKACAYSMVTWGLKEWRMLYSQTEKWLKIPNSPNRG